MKKILLTKDLKKIENISLVKIKKLINSFQIIEESYSKNIYIINLKIQYDDIKVKKLLGKKNISFSQPEKISAVFYPILFSNGDLKSFSENYFYTKWEENVIENQIINFILPLDDLDDITKILQMKDSLEEINVNELIKKYNESNYVIALLDYKDQKLNVHLKVNFENNKINKNILYPIEDINNENNLNFILKDIKLKAIEVWKEQNLINLLMPLSINVLYEHKNIKNFQNLKISLKKISIIDSYDLEEFNIKNSFFKIYYYGNPKKLKSELLKFGYKLKNVEGYWQLYKND